MVRFLSFDRVGDAVLRAAPALALGIALATAAPAAGQATRKGSPPVTEIVLHGVHMPADRERYRELPFDVPAGTERMVMRIDSDAPAQNTSLDIGLRDPDRLRGWSGSSKAVIVLEEADATPSYLPGPLVAGRWHVIVSAPGTPDVKPATIHYTIHIAFEPANAPFPGFSATPVRAGAAWYRGDLHMHSAYSDGTCKSVLGREVPCPVYRTLEAARVAGLDFIALTDHNSAAQNETLREMAPYFDDLLIIPGQEVTMLRGHANVFGSTGALDFRVGYAGGPGFNRLLDQVAQRGGLLSVNHPGAPCCLWTMQDVDYGRVGALEVLNGGNLDDTGSAEGRSSFPLWEKLLDAGYRISGIGGSDNHDGTQRIEIDGEGVGRPTTVAYAAELSQPAILEALRRGHVFVDVYGVRGRLIETEARAGSQRAMMGDTLTIATGNPIDFTVHVVGLPAGSSLSVTGNAGAEIDPALRRVEGEAHRSFHLTADGKPHWVRVDVRDASGQLILIGNPIYLRPAD